MKKAVEHILQCPLHGEGFILTKNNSFIGLMFLFYEFSEWRQGLTVYVHDITLTDQVPVADYRQVIESVLHFAKKELKKELKQTCLRIVLDEKLKIIELLKEIGLEDSSYRVYEKKM